MLLTGYFGGYSTEPGGVHEVELAAAHAIAAAVRAQDKPVVVHTIFPTSPTSDDAAGGRDPGAPRRRPGVRGAGRAGGSTRCPSYDEQPPAGRADHRPVVRRGEGGVRRRRHRASPPRARCTSADELADALAATGFPLVLKALGQVHKSDAGGVVLGLRDEAAALASYDDLVARLAPPAVSVEAMADLGRRASR